VVPSSVTGLGQSPHRVQCVTLNRYGVLLSLVRDGHQRYEGCDGIRDQGEAHTYTIIYLCSG